MAYVTTTIPEDWVGKLDRAASTARNNAATIRALATAGEFNRTQLINLRELVIRLISVIDEIQALPTYMPADRSEAKSPR